VFFFVGTSLPPRSPTHLTPLFSFFCTTNSTFLVYCFSFLFLYFMYFPLFLPVSFFCVPSPKKGDCACGCWDRLRPSCPFIAVVSPIIFFLLSFSQISPLFDCAIVTEMVSLRFFFCFVLYCFLLFFFFCIFGCFIFFLIFFLCFIFLKNIFTFVFFVVLCFFSLVSLLFI